MTFTRYAFDLDGPAFGTFMKEKLEAQMRQKRELPPSVNLDTPAMYNRATGQREIWLDEAGLPLRVTADLTFPQEGSNPKITAQIKNDYFNYNRQKLAQATTGFMTNPTAWLAHHNPLPQTATDWHNAGMHLTSWLLIAGMLAFAASYMHTPAAFIR